jgi:hypothetical protein
MSIYSQVKRGIDKVAPRVFNDPGLTATLTWKVFLGSIWNSDLKKNVETYKEYTVVAVKVMKEFSSTAPRALVPGAGGLIQGEIRFVVQAADAPPGYSYRDLLTEGSTTYAIDEYTEVMQDFVIVDVKGLG